MEDLLEIGVVSAHYLASDHYFNKGKDLKELTRMCPAVDPVVIAQEAFKYIASMQCMLCFGVQLNSSIARGSRGADGFKAWEEKNGKAQSVSP